MSDLIEIRSARIVSDGTRRISLIRQWDRTKRFMVVVGLNPSTADAEKDDQTIRRVRHFARREGCGGLYMVNLHDFRATQPADLWKHLGGYGEKLSFHPQSYLGQALKMGGLNVAAWGAFKNEPNARREFLRTFSRVKLFCLGKTQTGAPRHPSRLPNDQPLEEFRL